jgi:hypothetical protein
MQRGSKSLVLREGLGNETRRHLRNVVKARSRSRALRPSGANS